MSVGVTKENSYLYSLLHMHPVTSLAKFHDAHNLLQITAEFEHLDDSPKAHCFRYEGCVIARPCCPPWRRSRRCPPPWPPPTRRSPSCLCPVVSPLVHSSPGRGTPPCWPGWGSCSASGRGRASRPRPRRVPPRPRVRMTWPNQWTTTRRRTTRQSSPWTSVWRRNLRPVTQRRPQ